MAKTLAAAFLVCALTWLPQAVAGTAPPRGGHGPESAKGHGAAFRKIHQQIKSLQAACKADPKAWEPRYKLADLAMRYGLAKVAAKRIDEALALKPDDPATLELAGGIRYKLKEYGKAIELWTKALKLLGTSSKLRVLIDQAEKRRAEGVELAKLDAKLKKEPRDAASLLARARLRAKRREWKEALADLTVLLEAKPDAAEALGLAAMANFRLKHLTEAIGLWSRAVKAEPENQEYPLRLKEAQHLKQAHEGLARVREQLAKTPNDGKLRMQAGELWAKVGRHDYAALNLGQAVLLLPKNPAAHELYGKVLLRLGRMQEAVKEFEACKRLDPSNAEYTALLAKARATRNMHRAFRKGRGPVPMHGGPSKRDSKN